MSRWFRHYAGMMRDDKLVSVALRAKQPVERVLWVWGAILESAAEIDDEGRYDLDAAEVSYFLRADEADIYAILDGLATAKRVAKSRVVNWGSRQFQSDRSASRQAAYRERRRSDRSDGDNLKTSHDDQVTAESRHGDAPETETETETERKKEPGASLAGAHSPKIRDAIARGLGSLGSRSCFCSNSFAGRENFARTRQIPRLLARPRWPRINQTRLVGNVAELVSECGRIPRKWI